MLSMRDVKAQDLQGLSPDAVTALAMQMLQHIQHQDGELQSQNHELEIKLLQRKDRAAKPCLHICAASNTTTSPRAPPVRDRTAASR